jgi:ferrochelatase
MMFTAPTMDQAVAELQTLKPDGVIALSMFPHYSLATTHSAFHFFDEALNRAGLQDLPVHWIPAWFRHPLYIEALAESIRLGVQSTPGDGPLHLVFTPHGLPVSFLDRGDPYPDHIRASVDAVLRLLDWQEPAHIGWQSRVGPVAWLTPSTPDVLAAVAEAGGRRVCLVPISFLSEHIETLVEIDVEYREEAQKMGIPHWGRAPALGMADGLLNTLADLVQSAVPALSHAHCVRCLRLRTIVEPMRSKCPNCHFQPPKGLLDRPRPS